MHRDQLRPAEQLGSGLGPPRADEQATFAKTAGQRRQALLDAAVEMADRAEVLRAGDDLARLDGLARRDRRHESLRIQALHASGRSRYRKCVSESVPNGSSRNCTPPGRSSLRRGKFGRLSGGAAPIAVITLKTSARCSISSTAMPVSTSRQRATAAACSAVSPSSGPAFRLKLAYRYWHMIRCST